MPEPNYRHLENKNRKQHYVSILIERLSGKDPQAIAETLHMTEKSVRRDLEYVQRNWSAVFSPDGSTQRPRVSRASDFGELKIETKCKECTAQIGEGEERLVIAVLEPAGVVTFDQIEEQNGILVDRGGIYETLAGKTSCNHYCKNCSVKLPEFRISNPAFGDDESGDASEEERLVIDRAPVQVAAGAPDMSAQSGEEVQKKALRMLLDHPNSARMRPEMRAAAKMWVEGLSQNEIAKMIGKNQATVSRLLAAARQMAAAPLYARYASY